MSTINLLERRRAAHELSDADLVAAAQRDGDVGPAFRELYRRYHRPLYTFARRRLNDGSAAEEVVQETFVRLWRATTKYDATRGSLGALIFTIARNLIIDRLRRGRRTVPTTPYGEDGEGPSTTPTDDVDTGLSVLAALDRLPAAHREVLDLAYRGDMTQAQIASALRIPLGTVKSRVFAALQGLRAELRTAGMV